MGGSIMHPPTAHAPQEGEPGAGADVPGGQGEQPGARLVAVPATDVWPMGQFEQAASAPLPAGQTGTVGKQRKTASL